MFAVFSMVRGPHWALHPAEANALAERLVVTAKRLEPYTGSIAAKLGPLAILADIAALGAVGMVIVRPRIDADKQLAALRAGHLAHAAGAPVAAVEPAGVHRASATELDAVRRYDGADGELQGVTLADTDPGFVDRVAQAGAEVGVTSQLVAEVYEHSGEDRPVLEVLAPLPEGATL